MKPVAANHLKLIRLAFVWAALICAYYYYFQVVLMHIETRVAFVNSLVAGNEKADYQYAMYFIAHLHYWLTNTFGHPLIWHTLTDCVGILFLFWCAYHFIRKEFGSPESYLAGLLFLIIPLPLFLVDHYYHSTDFWAVGIMFYMIRAARAENSLLLAGLLFVSGMLWEKALFVPVVYGLYMFYKKGLQAAIKATLLPVLAVSFWFVWFRVAFPLAPRVLIFSQEQFFRNLPYDLVTWTLWLGPLFILLSGYLRTDWKSDPFWLFLLLYIPALIITLISLTATWGELRTFWILQPIIVGFVAAFFHDNASRYGKPTIDSYS
jgi:hypothetical protein